MNAFSTIDIDALPLAPEVSLATVETLTPAIVFVPGGVEKIISKLEEEVRATPRDISTAAGRKAVASLAYKVAQTKTGLDEMGKETVAGIKKQAGLIDADRRIIRDRLDALRDEVRADLTAYEEAETARVDEYERALVWIIESPRFPAPPISSEIRSKIAQLADLGARDWQEFRERAEAAATEAGGLLEQMLAAAIQAEADAAELAMLRRQRVEREEADRAAEVERQRQIAAQEATARQAIREQQEAEAAAAREHQRAEQAKRDQEAAAARAVEDERKRVAAAQAAEEAARQKREANKKHRAKIHNEIARALVGIIGEHSDAAGPAAMEAAETIVDEIAAGNITRLSITY